MVVMEGEQHAVARRMNIGFDIAIAEINRPLKGGHGVLRPRACPAPMGEGQNTVMLKIGKLRRSPHPLAARVSAVSCSARSYSHRHRELTHRRGIARHRT